MVESRSCSGFSTSTLVRFFSLVTQSLWAILWLGSLFGHHVDGFVGHSRPGPLSSFGQPTRKSLSFHGPSPFVERRIHPHNTPTLHMAQDHHHHYQGTSSRHSNSTTLSATAVASSEMSNVHTGPGLYNQRTTLSARRNIHNEYILQELDFSQDYHHPTHQVLPSPFSGAGELLGKRHGIKASTTSRQAHGTEYAMDDISWHAVPQDSSFSSRDSTQDQASLAVASEQLEHQETEARAIMVARLLLIGAAALYGTNFSLVKLMGQETTLPVGVSSTLRFGLAALATSPWLFAPSKEERPTDETKSDSQVATSSTPSAAWGSFVGGFEVGLLCSIGYIAQAVGLETTLASQSAFLCSLAVVVVPFLDFMAGRKLKGREWMGAIMAMVGVAFLEFGTSANDWAVAPSWSYGDWASMLQPFAFGMGFWRMERKYYLKVKDTGPRKPFVPDSPISTALSSFCSSGFIQKRCTSTQTKPADARLLNSWPLRLALPFTVQ